MLSFFLAKRFFSNEHQTLDPGKNKASRPAIRIATGGIAIGLAVMVISICFVKGFQDEIRRKITGFGAHIEILDVNAFASPESYPIRTDSSLIQLVREISGSQHVQRVSEKMGVLKTQNDFAGIVLKGIAQDYDFSFLKEHIVAGKIPEFKDNGTSNSIIISQVLADALHLKVGDRIFSYFFAESIKQRRFQIAAIYNTHMPQFDKSIVWTDLYTVNRLNGWESNQSSGLEVILPSFDDIPQAQSALTQNFAAVRALAGPNTAALSVKDNPRSASILSWLELLDFNILIILIIMIGVAGITMISGLLILILERTNTIGILKALGCSNSRIRHTFLWFAALIIVRGMVIGNVISLCIVGLQDSFHLLKLNPETYYIDYVPVEFNLSSILILNGLTLLVTILTLIIPSLFVSRIEPAKSIQFD